jgi:ADP-heptose:LPS heptosyltransferase
LTLWNRIEQWGKHNLLRYTEKVMGKIPVSPESVPFDRIRRILVIRSHDQLGDFLLSTPALEALRARFPEAHIGILVRSYCRDTVKNNPCVDSILVHYENGRQWTWPRVRTLAAGLIKKWDMAVVLSSESHSLTSDLWAYLSGAKYIAGSERFVFNGCSRNFLYNLTAPDGGPEKHQSARNLEIVEQFGAGTNDLREKVYVTPEEKSSLRLRFPDLYDGRPVIGLHIGANKTENRWPVSKFCELSRKLTEQTGARIAVFWGPREHSLAEAFLRDAEVPLAPVEPSSLRNQAIHFSLCHLAVCNDTGIMHLCAAVGTPLVSIFGPTDPAVWKPVGDHVAAVRSDDGKTPSVSLESVLREALRLWKAYKPGSAD